MESDGGGDECDKRNKRWWRVLFIDCRYISKIGRYWGEYRRNLLTADIKVEVLSVDSDDIQELY